MSEPIESIEGIEATHSDKLRAAGIQTLDGLLEAARRSSSRRALAEATGIGQGRLLQWAKIADLRRIASIARPHVELLQRSGVDCVRELRNRNTENLAEKLEAVNAALQICPKAPERELVQRWIDHAKALPLIIEV